MRIGWVRSEPTRYHARKPSQTLVLHMFYPPTNLEGIEQHAFVRDALDKPRHRGERIPYLMAQVRDHVLLRRDLSLRRLSLRLRLFRHLLRHIER